MKNVNKQLIVFKTLTLNYKYLISNVQKRAVMVLL